MKVLIQNGKMIPVDENTELPNEVLTKHGLEEMYKGNMEVFGKFGGIISIVGIGLLGFFCLLPVIIMLSTGMSFDDVWPILAVFAAFVLIWLLVHKLPKKSMQKKYDAITNGQFRLLRDTIADKSVYTHRDSDSHITTHTYYIKGTKHPEDRRMFDSWWTVSQVGDEVYMFEVANKKGKYRPCEVFPAKLFTLDSELEAYVDRESVNTGGFEV